MPPMVVTEEGDFVALGFARVVTTSNKPDTAVRAGVDGGSWRAVLRELSGTLQRTFVR